METCKTAFRYRNSGLHWQLIRVKRCKSGSLSYSDSPVTMAIVQDGASNFLWRLVTRHMLANLDRPTDAVINFSGVAT